MKHKTSYTSIGNSYLHQMRNRINHSEDVVDLENSFSQTVSSLLKEVFSGNDIEIMDDDIRFDPNSKIYYSLSARLDRDQEFMEIWKNSDLRQVISKFADSVYHRFLHLSKHHEKTNIKIRN